MKVQPFVLLGNAQRNAFNASFSSDADAWAADWFARPPAVEVTSAPITNTFHTHRECNGLRLADASGVHWVVYSIDETQWMRLGAMLLADQEASARNLPAESLLFGLIRSALLDLTLRLLPLPEGEYGLGQDTLAALLPDDAFTPGHEALHLTIDVQDAVIHSWLPLLPVLPRIGHALPEPSLTTGGLIKPREAIGNQRLSFEIHLGSAELTLGAIGKLAVGDVIRLDKDLQDPLNLVCGQSPLRFTGYLGKQHGHFAFLIDGIRE